MHRRQLLTLAAGCAAASLAAPVRAQRAQPLRIVIGFAPGGSTDAMARLLADELRVVLGQTVIVENKAGASGRLAMEMVKAAPPDGDLLVLAPHGATTLFPHIYKNLRYDPTKDFTPLSRVTQSDYCIAVSAASPARDAASLRQWAKSQGNRLAYGSPGAGTVLHFLGLQIGSRLGIELAHVPYRGAAPALTDLVGGTLQAVVTPLADPLEMHRADKVRILATTGAERTRLVEGIPTMKESGADIDVTGWNGLYGPAGLSAATVERLHKAVQQALQSPALQQRLLAIGTTAAPLGGAELAALLRSESTEWGNAVRASGFTPEN